MNKLIVAVFLLVTSINLEYILSLSEKHPVEDNAIIAAESKIREIINNFLEVFKLSTSFSRKLERYLSVHNYLLLDTLQDQDNLRAIVEHTRLKHNENISKDFIDSVNEIFEENRDFDTRKLTDNDIIFQLSKNFLNELNVINTKYGTDIDVESLIRDELIRNGTTFRETNFIVSEEETNNRRVYKGKKVKVKYFPFLASIMIFQKFYCAGSIISSDVIITAASCVQQFWSEKLFRENPTFLAVRVGSSSTTRGGEIHSVAEVIFHPTYDSKLFKDNLVLLRLTKTLRFSSKSKKPLRKIDFDGRKSHLSKKQGAVTILGWGSKVKDNHTAKHRLTYAKLKVITIKKCKSIYTEKHIERRQTFCARSSTKVGGACELDVGDPGLVNGVLTGIVSFGSATCGYSNNPTVFTKLGYYSLWIENILEQFSTGTTNSKYEPKQNHSKISEQAPSSPSSLVTTTKQETTASMLDGTVKPILRYKTKNTKAFKIEKFTDNGQAPPIYIADGVKSILYNNEYNIYFVTEKQEGPDTKAARSKIKEQNKSQENLSNIDTNSSGSDDSSDTSEITIKINKPTKRIPPIMETNSAASLKVTPNVLLDWNKIDQDVKNKSRMYIDMLQKKDSKSDGDGFKKNSSKLSTKLPPGHVTPNTSYLYKDFAHFLKFPPPSMTSRSDHLDEKKRKRKRHELRHSHLRFGGKVSNSHTISTTPSIILINNNSVTSFSFTLLSNNIQAEYRQIVLKKKPLHPALAAPLIYPQPKDGNIVLYKTARNYSNGLAHATAALIFEEQLFQRKSFQDSPKILRHNNGYLDDYYSSESKEAQNHSSVEDYNYYYELLRQNEMNNLAASYETTTLQSRKFRKIRTTKMKRTFRKKYSKHLRRSNSIVNHNKINNSINEHLTPENKSANLSLISEDYVYSLIEKAVDDVEVELQKNMTVK